MIARHSTPGHSDDVLAIIDKASKDIAVEELLKNLEEVWLSMTFQFKSHTRIHGGDQVMGAINACHVYYTIVRVVKVMIGDVHVVEREKEIAGISNKLIVPAGDYIFTLSLLAIYIVCV